MGQKRTRTTTQRKRGERRTKATSRPVKPDVPGFTPFECDCGGLESSARQSGVPIVYDEKFNEYHIVGENGSQTIIHHCPFCGGYPPPSRRYPLVEPVAVQEILRLLELTKDLKNVVDVMAAFGRPDEEGRTLRYNGLSETAVVEVVEDYKGSVRFAFSTKGAESKIETGAG